MPSLISLKFAHTIQQHTHLKSISEEYKNCSEKFQPQKEEENLFRLFESEQN